MIGSIFPGLVLQVAGSASVDPAAGARVGDLVAGGLIAVFLAIGAYHLLLFVLRRAASENLLFGLLCLLAALYAASLSSAFAEATREYVDPSRLRLLALLAAAPLYVGLLGRLLDRRPGRLARGAGLGFLLLTPAAALAPPGLLARVSPVLCTTTGLGLVASIVWVLRERQRQPALPAALAAGVVGLTVALGWDLLGELAVVPVARVLPGAPGVFWIGLLSLVVAMGVHTANRFAAAEASARTDPLTGLVRRHVLEEALAREAERRRRAGGTLILLVLDLDRFKHINDTHGHRAGDVVLARVGHLLRHTARNIDLAARMGGEEFAVLLADTDAEGAARFADRFRERLRELEVAVPGGVVSGMTVSVGLAVAAPGIATDALLDAADDAMYCAKQTGRDRVVSVSLAPARYETSATCEVPG